MARSLEAEQTKENEESKMKLTEEEKEICKTHRRRHEDGKTRCKECPLVIDAKWCICKANCTEEEYCERKKM